MAASFTAQPATRCSAYRPVAFKVQSDATTDAIEKIVVRVYAVDGDTLLASYRTDWKTRTGSDPTYTYQFEFDIQGLMQSLLEPFPSAKSGTILEIGAVNGYAPDAAMGVYVTVNFEFRNTDNLLEEDPATLTSSDIYVFTIARQHDEDQSLAPYYDEFTRLLLTDAPDRIPIRLNDLYSASFIFTQDADYLGIEVRYKDGSTHRDAAPLSFSSPAGAHNKKVGVVGVGPRQINDVTGWVDTGVTIDNTVASYTVGFGQTDETLTWVSFTQTLTFDLIDRCAASLRLHWLNDRGGGDAYTVNGLKRDVVEVKSGRGEKPLTWTAGISPYHDKNQRGRYRLDVRREDGYEVETRIVDVETARWLASLVASPEVYIEVQGADYYLPAMITDGKIVVDDSEEVGSILKLTVELANGRVIQRN